MTPVILMAVALLLGLCVLAFRLAAYALPLMAGLAAGRLAIACGAPIAIVAVFGLVAAVSSFSALVYLQAIQRHPAARLAVAVIYATPAAVAGYALMFGVLNGVQMEGFIRQCLCLAGGGFVAVSAISRLTAWR
ncbi:hypothetical protein [Rhizobium sp. CCGE531]|uniref:hypothetical protein n=1 Tax=Rhizobium sp. CCGE531 TaxID=2364271 RepID=UPI0013C43F40|nr:hypothetical protein [Rhizobium sp. CCGE531]